MNPNTTPANSVAPSGRVRLEGVLDMVRASDSTFTLRLDDGQEIHGHLVGRPMHTLARFVSRRLVVFVGNADDSADVEMDGFLPVNGLEVGMALEHHQTLTAEEIDELGKRLRSMMGQWPGTETDEQIEQALKGLR